MGRISRTPNNSSKEAVLLQLNEVKRLGFSNAYLEEHGLKPIQIPSQKGKKPSDQWDLTPLVV